MFVPVPQTVSFRHKCDSVPPSLYPSGCLLVFSVSASTGKWLPRSHQGHISIASTSCYSFSFSLGNHWVRGPVLWGCRRSRR